MLDVLQAIGPKHWQLLLQIDMPTRYLRVTRSIEMMRLAAMNGRQGKMVVIPVPGIRESMLNAWNFVDETKKDQMGRIEL